MVSIFLLAFLFQQESVPFKPTEEFEIKLEYEFRKRTPLSASEQMIREANQQPVKLNDASPLPYVILNLKIKEVSDQEVRLKVFQSDKPFFAKRKIEAGSEVKIELGFTDDMKDRVSAFEYTLYFLSEKKVEVSKIEIFVDEVM